MNKIRKLAEALWYNKERIVLGVMVCILLWHVYGIFYPEPEAQPKPLTKPDPANIPGVVAELIKQPDEPETRAVGQWEGIYTPNPFWALGTQVAAASRGSDSGDNISLIQLQRVGNKYRAQIMTNIPGWYSEGDMFESYRLLKINPEDNSVEVSSERSGKLLTLKAQRN